MMSLTAFLPFLVSHLGMTQAAIYERQRALVRLGLLEKPVGRGRGSGAKATPETVAMIFLSVLATDNLSDVDGRIDRLAQATYDAFGRKRTRCPFTNAQRFHEALAAIIASPDLASRVIGVRVQRESMNATIVWTAPESKEWTNSHFGNRSALFGRSFDVTASIHGEVLRPVATALSAEGTVQ